jgi:glyoxylase-like metal-dependent hydrolase (beta-lactamase superfamily II)
MSTTFRVGDMTIHRIIEQEEPLFDPLTFFPDLKQEVLEENRPWMEQMGALDAKTGHLTLCIQSYLVQTPHHNVLVDTCVGNHKNRPTRPFWHQMTHDKWTRGLAATGLKPEDIHYVMCTHLHVDHVGWNTTLENGRWVPTFPKARYLFAETELNHWVEEHKREPNDVIADSVIPVIEAGRVDVVKETHQLGDHLRLTPTPGHTPGHVAIEIGKGGRTEAVLTGDLIHSPLQARYPGLGMRADTDRAQGGVTRRKFLECHCEANTLLCTGHFPSPSSGRVSRWGEGFRFTAEAV